MSSTKKPSSLDKKIQNWSRIIIIISILFVVIIIPIAIYVSAVFTTKSDVSKLGNFLNFAMWVQVILALINLIILARGFYSFIQLNEQIKIDHQRLKSEVYRILISREIQSIKRFISSSDVQEFLKKIDPSSKVITLEDIRIELLALGEGFTLPLLPKDEKPSLDHVEFVINEYNYICMLLDRKTISDDFGTDQSIRNIWNVFYNRNLYKLVYFRRQTSTEYASHYVSQASRIGEELFPKQFEKFQEEIKNFA